MIDQEFDQEIMSVLMGRTFLEVLYLSDVMPMTSKLETRKDISTYLLSLCQAIDDNKIEFKEDASKAMLFGLMTISLQIFLDGREQNSGVSLH